MEGWRFQKTKDDNAVAGIITAAGPEAKDCDLAGQFPYMEFGVRSNGKAVVIDREKIDREDRFATVTIKDGKPAWDTLAIVADPATVEKVHALVMKAPELVWDSGREDQEVLEKGTTIMWATGSTKRIQAFVESLSYQIGVKADWSFQGGRAHIEVMPGGLSAARKLIEDKEFMSQFYKSYNDDPNDYFERLR